MKHAIIIATLLLAVGSASAANQPQSTSQKQGQVAGQTQGQNTAVDSAAYAGANNAGNAQSITFTSPEKSTVTVNSNVSGTTTANVNQNVSGTTTQNQNVSVSGTTTQNQTVNQTINGKQEQVVSGGTNNTIRQEFGTQTIKNTPSVSGPPLTASNDTCMGSASGSVNAPGFGLSLGKTYTDANCVMLKNSRELWNMGMKAASMALMCQDKNNREALEVTGFTCPARKSQD